jgi:hypothetical protein
MLPFFWLTLIKEQDIQAIRPEMERVYLLWEDEEAYEKYEEEESASTHIKISKAYAITNAQLAIPFIKANFPAHMVLYADFISYLNQHLTPADTVELDMIALAAFTDIDTFLNGVIEDLRAISEGNVEKVSGYFTGNDMHSLVGFDDFAANEFKDHSPGYKQASAHYTVEREEKKAKQKVVLTQSQQASRKTKAVIALAIGLMFLFFTYKGFSKEGFTPLVMLCFILGIASVAIGVSKLLSKHRKV